MTTLKQHISHNIFPLLLSIIIAITAGAYIHYLQKPEIWEIALWATTAFIVIYITTYLVSKFLQKILSSKKRLFSYSLYTATILLICILFIFPAVFLITDVIVEDNKHSICCETPLDYGAADYQSEKFKLADGITISGWYIAPTTHKNSLIILIHGHYADRRATREWAKMLIAAGYGIYMYDQRGHGESEGVLDYVYSNFASDLLNIKNQLLAKHPTKQLGAVGLSMGAHALINAFAQDQSA